MYNDLSEKQIEILNYIKYQISSKGYPPAIREICMALQIRSTSTVHNQINILESKGYIRRDPTKNRALEVLSKDDEVMFPTKKTIDVPIIGQVTAGEPILAQEQIEDTFPIPIDFASKGSLFFLKIKGESMINAGILDGDMVLVRQQNTANNGDIVVALIEDSATVKTYYREVDHVRLQPENDAMSPIIVKQASILGKVISLIRNY